MITVKFLITQYFLWNRIKLLRLEYYFRLQSRSLVQWGKTTNFCILSFLISGTQSKSVEFKKLAVYKMEVDFYKSKLLSQ